MMELLTLGLFVLLALIIGVLAGSASRTQGAVATPMAIVVGLGIFVLCGTVLLILRVPTTPALVSLVSLAVVALARRFVPSAPVKAAPWWSLIGGSSALTVVTAVVSVTVAETVSEDSFDNTNLAGLLASGRGDVARTFTLLLRPPALALLHGPSVITGRQFSSWVAPLVLLLLVWLLLSMLWEELGAVGTLVRPVVVSGVAVLLFSLPMIALNLTYISAHALTGLFVLVGGWGVSSALRGRLDNIPELALALAVLTAIRADGSLYSVLLVLPLLASSVPWNSVRVVLRALGSAFVVWWGFLGQRTLVGDSTASGTPYELTLVLGLVGLLALGASYVTVSSSLDGLRHRLRPAVELLPLALLALAWVVSDEGLRVVARRLQAALIEGQGGWTILPMVLLGLALLTAGMRRSRESWNLRFLVITAPAMLIALRVLEGLQEGQFERFVWGESLSRAVLHLLPSAILLVVLVFRGDGSNETAASEGRRTATPELVTLVAGIALVGVVVPSSGLGLIGERPGWLPDLGLIEAELAAHDRVLIVRGPLMPIEIERAVALTSGGRVEMIAADEVEAAIQEAAVRPLVIMPACASLASGGREVALSSIDIDGRRYRWVALLPGEQRDAAAISDDVALPYTGAARSHGILAWFGADLGRRDFHCNPATLGLVAVEASSVLDPSAESGPLSHRSLRGLVDGWDWQEILHTGNAEDEQFRVDLRRDVLIEGLTVSQRTDGSQNLIRRFVVEGSWDGDRWERLVSGLHVGGPGERQYFDVKAPTLGPWREFRIRLDGPNSDGDRYLVLGEFELYGTVLGDEQARPTGSGGGS